jgi:hypothetical protein
MGIQADSDEEGDTGTEAEAEWGVAGDKDGNS